MSSVEFALGNTPDGGAAGLIRVQSAEGVLWIVIYLWNSPIFITWTSIIIESPLIEVSILSSAAQVATFVMTIFGSLDPESLINGVPGHLANSSIQEQVVHWVNHCVILSREGDHEVDYFIDTDDRIVSSSRIGPHVGDTKVLLALVFYEARLGPDLVHVLRRVCRRARQVNPTTIRSLSSKSFSVLETCRIGDL